jgi:hypothetical protein
MLVRIVPFYTNIWIYYLAAYVFFYLFRKSSEKRGEPFEDPEWASQKRAFQGILLGINKQINPLTKTYKRKKSKLYVRKLGGAQCQLGAQCQDLGAVCQEIG